MNTNFLVYTDEKFETKEDAYAYLDAMGLIDMVNECIGSVILVTPIVPLAEGSSGGMTGGFDAADQAAYYQLQSAMCNLLFALGGAAYA